MSSWEISVHFDGFRWNISPDPAVVNVGDVVQWRFQSQNHDVSQVRWSVYFSHGFPFINPNPYATPAIISADRDAGHTPQVLVEEPGDYKYGVRAQAPSGQILGDEDPRLIVLKA